MSGDLFVLLLVLVGGLAFTFGGCIGSQITLAVFRERDMAHARERRVLNEVWRALRDEFDIDRATWMAADIARERFRKRYWAPRGMAVLRGRSITPDGRHSERRLPAGRPNNGDNCSIDVRIEEDGRKDA